MEDLHESDTRENGKDKKIKKFNGGKIADNIIKGIIMLIMAVAFVMIADQIVTTPYFSAEIEGEMFHGNVFGTTLLTVIAYIVGVVLGLLLGYIISPFVLRLIWKAIERIEIGLNDFESQDLIVGTLGLLFGLIIANLIGLAFARLPIIGAYGPIVFSIIFGYAGMSIAIRKRNDIIGLVGTLRIGKQNKDNAGVVHKHGNDVFSGKLLDTSSIIDGRIAEICSTGFLEGPLLVPVFVLEELQLIADSSDLLKRN